MPLYEYRCRQCGHQFELIQKFSDPPADRCEKCGGAVEKLLSAPGLQFKGSGFYITDYARKEKAATPKGEPAGAPGKSTDKSDKSADKPAAPAPTGGAAASKKESGASGSGGSGNASTPPSAVPAKKP